MPYTNRTSELRSRGNISGRRRSTTTRRKPTPIQRSFRLGSVVAYDGEEFLIASSRYTEKGVLYELINSEAFEIEIKHKQIDFVEKDSPDSLRDLKKFLAEKF